MDKYNFPPFDHTQPAHPDGPPDPAPMGGSLEDRRMPGWRAGTPRWRGWPVLAIGALVVGIVVALNQAASDHPPAAVVSTASQAGAEAPAAPPADAPASAPTPP